MMTEDDGFFGLFKESSESDRNFDFKQSGWDKLNSKLNEDNARRRRKYLLILPWILLPGLLIVNGILYYQQKNTNEKIAVLYKELSEKEQIKTDTIIQQIHTFSHDTVYVYISGQPLSNAAINKVIEDGQRIKSKKPEGESNDLANLNATKPDGLPAQGVEKPEDKTQNPASQNTDKQLNIIAESGNLNNKIKDNETLVDSINKADNITEDSADTTEIMASDVDSVLKAESIASENSIQQNRRTFGEYLKTVTLEYGVQAGVVFPEKDAGTRTFGFNAGAGMNAKLAKNFHLTSVITYGSLFINAGRTNKSAWIQPENSPDSGYVLDNASTRLSTISLNIGLRYNVPIAKHVDLLFDIKYGAGYILPYKVIYEFKNQNPNQDLIVEKKPEHFGFVPNDLLFGLGLSYKRNEKHTFYLLSHYWINRHSTLYRLPDNFGISLGLYY